MIRYALTCSSNHRFESWFASAEAYESLSRAGHVTCPECGSSETAKSLMAPGVRPSRKAAKGAVPKDATVPVASEAPKEMLEAIARLREHVEKSSDYVGPKFAAEARSMHEGDTPYRPIWGETTPDEARALREDGVPALPLPFVPRRKTN